MYLIGIADAARTLSLWSAKVSRSTAPVYLRCRLKEMLMTLSSVKLFRLGIKAHLRCVDEGESPTWIQQTVSLAYMKSMAVVCLVLVDNRLWTVVPLREVAWMFWELAISRTGRRSTGTRKTTWTETVSARRPTERNTHPVMLLSDAAHHFWLCRSGCPAGTSSPPHRNRCRSPQC